MLQTRSLEYSNMPKRQRRRNIFRDAIPALLRVPGCGGDFGFNKATHGVFSVGDNIANSSTSNQL
jgi:hypothetical protein